MESQKSAIFDTIAQRLQIEGFNVINRDESRPWGGFFVIDEAQAQHFADTYFDGIDTESLNIGGKLSPKILIVAPNSRLSWQYHHRRAEIWQVLTGTVGIKTSLTDVEGELKEYHAKDQIKLQQGERHRLIGLNDWAVVAEIWQHTDSANPSDEDDIIRLQDDFGR